MFNDILIGNDAYIFYNKKKYNGKIVDETKNSIKLLTKKKILVFLKKNIIINIKNQKIQGKDIEKRPEERIKN
ncbi:MAG: hypothetical protein QXM96_00850 [Candidatus Woesearchaeota archaeon]